jgi:DNA-binding NtrC family response regulator
VVIVISGYGDIATAVEALQKGARTFLEKEKVSPQEIGLRVEHTLRDSVAERRIRQLEASQDVEEIIGDDIKVQKIRDLINLIAHDGETTVLIRGETGTGKELVARAIHRVGVRNTAFS